jgi:pilus assembly protein CpaB
MEPRQHRRSPRGLEPVLRQWWESLARRSGFGRTLLLRRVVAAVLVGLAAVLALAPGRAGSPDDAVVVAARDLAAGTVLEPGLVALRGIPEQVVPEGAARSPSAVLGRTLAAPVRRGELLTDVRLTGSDLARTISTNPDTVSVSLRLADPGVATLLRPGATVDVVTVGERQDEPVVLARGARVLAVLEADSHAGERAGRLVLVALDPVAATRVAAASISQTLTVTFR